MLIGLDECEGCQVHNLNCSKGTPMIQGFGCDGMFAEYTAIDRRKFLITESTPCRQTSISSNTDGGDSSSNLDMLTVSLISDNAIHLPENLEMETSAPIFCAGITGKDNLCSR